MGAGSSGLYYIQHQGMELPVIDLAHPSFAIDDSAANIQGLLQDYEKMEQQQRKLPPFLSRFLLKFRLKRSVIGRGMLKARGGFLDSVSTYLLKLGPQHLGPWAGGLDRRLVGSLSGLCLRLRLRALVGILSDAVAPLLEARPGAPLALFNLAAGPAPDSLNLLLKLARRKGALLAGRPIRVRLFDLDEEGPVFGRKCLEALQTAGGPLERLAIEWKWQAYDWNQVGALQEALTSEAGAIQVFSSEGGLFDYGSDAAIAANLRTLAQSGAKDLVVAGTLTRPDGPARLSRGVGAAVIPRSLAAFGALCEESGWKLVRAEETPIVRIFRLDRSNSQY